MNLPAKISLLTALLAGATASDAAELGRLFFTPEQRTRLEYGKLQSDQPGDNRRVLTVNGIVQRHGGERTVWVNGVAQSAGNSDERSPEAMAVAVPGKSGQIKIKVGQKLLLDPSSSQITSEPGK